MAGVITPLSRRPRWLLLVLVPLLGIALPTSVVNGVNSLKPFPNIEWIPVLYLLIFSSFAYWNLASLAVTDYDANYLYIFQTTGTQQIQLSSFYKLVAARGYWQLYYLDEQQRKHKLQIVPLNPGWFRTEGDSSIHGFIDAVWQHNPGLDVRYGWLK